MWTSMNSPLFFFIFVLCCGHFRKEVESFGKDLQLLSCTVIVTTFAHALFFNEKKTSVCFELNRIFFNGFKWLLQQTQEVRNPLKHLIQSHKPHSNTPHTHMLYMQTSAHVYTQALNTYALAHAHKLLFMQVIFLTVNE